MSKKNTDQTQKQKRDYKTWLLVGLAMIALVAIVIIIIDMNNVEKIDSSYFHDDDTKIVLTMDKEISALDDSEYEAGVVHIVYNYENEKITNARVFYEYPDAELAKVAMAHLGLIKNTNGKKLNDRFIIFQIDKSQFENMTVDELKTDVEMLKEIDALILDYNEDTVKSHGIDFTIDEDGDSEDNGDVENEDDSTNGSDGTENTATE